MALVPWGAYEKEGAIDEEVTFGTGVAMVAESPLAFLPADRRWALATGTVLADRVHGAGLFADISGFTPRRSPASSDRSAAQRNSRPT